MPALTSNPARRRPQRDFRRRFLVRSGTSTRRRRKARPTRSRCPTRRRGRGARTWSSSAANGTASRQSAYRDVQSRGFLNFVDQGYTGNALADLLLGLPVADRRRAARQPAEPARAELERVRARRLAGDASADDLRGRCATTTSSPPVDADDRANLYDPATGQLVAVGTGDMPRGGYEPDRNNVAPRAGFAWAMDREARTDPPRRLRHLLQPGRAGHVRRAVLQSAVLQPQRVSFPAPGYRRHARRSVPGVVPGLHSAVGDRVPARPADAVDGALERQRAAPDRAAPRDRDRLRRLARPRPDLRARHEPGARSPTRLLRPNPLFADITLIESRGTSRYNALQVRYQQRPAHGMSVLLALHARQVDRRRVGIFHERGRSELSAEQPRPRRRARPVVIRRPAPVLGRRPSCPCRSGRGSRCWPIRVAEQGARRHGTAAGRHVSERPAVHGRAAARRRQQQHRPIQPRVRLQRSAQRHRRHVAATKAPPTTWFDTVRVLDAARPGRSATADGTCLTGAPAIRTSTSRWSSTSASGLTTTVELRAEAFNLLNRVNYDLPDAFFGSPTFGRILSAQSPRRFQLGVRAMF